MMYKKTGLFIMIFGLILLTACGQSKNDSSSDAENTLKTLDVAFEVPETAKVGEEIELKAIVTYGDDKVADAHDVEFEYWEAGHKDDSKMLDVKNNKDGTYTQTVTFDQDGKYEIYAHVTARELHTMPKKGIMVGDVPDEDKKSDQEDDDHEDEEHHDHEN